MSVRDEILRPLLPDLVPVPAAGQLGICPTCLSSRTDGYDRCRPCSDAAYLRPPSILPVTMSVHGGAVHHHLRYYKDSADAAARERLGRRLAALLSLFVERHSTCIGEWDVACCVPSATRVALEPVVAQLRVFQGRHARLLQFSSDAAQGRNLDPEQFEVVDDVTGMRVLLLDDTLTSGAKLFSAVAAITRARGSIVGPVVLGRHVDPAWAPSAEMLGWLRERVWDEDRCARCDGEKRDAGALF